MTRQAIFSIDKTKCMKLAQLAIVAFPAAEIAMQPIDLIEE